MSSVEPHSVSLLLFLYVWVPGYYRRPLCLHWEELFPSVKLQNCYVDQKMSPLAEWWVEHGWNFNSGLNYPRVLSTGGGATEEEFTCLWLCNRERRERELKQRNDGTQRESCHPSLSAACYCRQGCKWQIVTGNHTPWQRELHLSLCRLICSLSSLQVSPVTQRRWQETETSRLSKTNIWDSCRNRPLYLVFFFFIS